ncbi:hypothetical protein X772_32185 [Mesorhizobium sp. LSJC280B00]|nr:hypothetical protein X772_32185 [Mesorhizobium sp. LSJC280B00]
MNIHKNARLTPLRREEMALAVIEGLFSKAHAARTYGVSAKIVARWFERYKAESRAGHGPPLNGFNRQRRHIRFRCLRRRSRRMAWLRFDILTARFALPVPHIVRTWAQARI